MSKREPSLGDVQKLKVADLKDAAINPRRHDEKQLREMAQSVQRFGFVVPVIVDTKNVIIAGHGRVEAAKRTGEEYILGRVAKNWPEVMRRKYLIFDNKITSRSKFDKNLMRDELQRLKDSAIGFEGMGFKEDDMLPPTTTKKKPIENRARTNPGDIWQLGDHRLMCGDSTDEHDVKRLMGAAKPTLMVTDPPYGVEYNPKWRDDVGGGSQDPRVDELQNDHRADWRDAYRKFGGNAMYVWHAATFANVVMESVRDVEFEPEAVIVWDKGHAAMGRSCYHWQHETCLYATRKGKKATWRGGKTQDTVWEIQKTPAHKNGHPTEKPVECMAKPIRHSSQTGDVIYDPFCGSGTTIMAAHQEGRVGFGMEIDPKYVDATLDRWERETGIVPKRVTDTPPSAAKKKTRGKKK